ncbi:MAG: ATP synthase F1 subunit gamma [Nitrospirae bacterium]|nr:ATP synthase F1 subunit gamma [Nitrospirota bacterium]
MPSLQHIRRKIASVKSTQKITKAMKMVAAAKLKRAQDRILSARPYAQKMAAVLKRLSRGVNRDLHPLLRRRDARKIELLVITADRGLCGAFNANILRRAQEFIREKRAAGFEVGLSVVGRKSRDFFRRRDIIPRQTWVQIFDRLNYAHGTEIGRDIVGQYAEGKFDELYLLYNEFKSVMQQRIAVEKLLPIEPAIESDDAGKPAGGDYLYEPDETVVLAQLLPKYIEVQVFRALLESAAGELGARMTAMDAATRNAGELIRKMTLVYNKTRQAVITKELMDIVGGAEAMRGG